eukprot:869104-Amphidinium_carterae.1
MQSLQQTCAWLQTWSRWLGESSPEVVGELEISAASGACPLHTSSAPFAQLMQSYSTPRTSEEQIVGQDNNNDNSTRFTTMPNSAGQERWKHPGSFVIQS